jgi:hypothetical protein
MCDVLLPPGVNPTAVKYISYQSYRERERERERERGSERVRDPNRDEGARRASVN